MDPSTLLKWLAGRRLNERTTEVGPAAEAKRLARELGGFHTATVGALANALEARDDHTHDHGVRVGRLAQRLAAELGHSGIALDGIQQAGLLHDMGKIGIPEAILQKPAPLTVEEREGIERHAVNGHNLVARFGASADKRRAAAPDTDPQFAQWRQAIEDHRRSWDYIAHSARHHHERWDGAGYPDGLAGAQIPEVARVVALCEVYDSLTHDQPWRKAWSREDAAAHIAELRARAFDPDMTDAFLRMLGREPSDQ